MTWKRWPLIGDRQITETDEQKQLHKLVELGDHRPRFSYCSVTFTFTAKG